MKNTPLDNTLRLAFALIAATVWTAATAWAASPSLGVILPRGTKVGEKITVTFHGDRLQDAQEVLYHGPGGVSIDALEVENNKAVKVTMTVAPDAPFGEHLFRLRCEGGVSDVKSFYVGPFPAVAEKDDKEKNNNDFAEPQPIELNVTVHGTADREDVDYYQVNLKKGQRLSVEVEGMRLGDTMFDPYVAVYDAKRFPLAATDDTALLLQDPYAQIVAPEDGQYVVEVRESSYQGNGACRYLMHVGDFARPSVAYPPVIAAGAEAEVTMVGDIAGDFKQKVVAPDAADDSFQVVPRLGDAPTPSPVTLAHTKLALAAEAEPNNEWNVATPTGHAAPLVCYGVVDKPGDVDFFKFSAKKDQQFDVSVLARGLRSPLDPVLNVFSAKDGKHIGGNDDSGGPDAKYRFTAPEDGEYVVRVYDHLTRGGPEYVYAIWIANDEPSLSISVPFVDRNRSNQERQMMAVPRGNRFVTLLQFNRVGFGGDLNVTAPDLPTGMTMHAMTVPSNQGQFPVVFEAAPDAPVGGKLTEVVAEHVDPKVDIRGDYGMNQPLVNGQPNNTVYYGADLDKIAVAGCKEAPFTVEFVEPKAPLVQDGSMNVKIVVKRAEGFDNPVRVYLPYRPPGVGATGSILVNKGETEGLYTLNANARAQTGEWPLAFLAFGDTSEGRVWISSQLGKLAVAEPFVKANLAMTATVQGEEAVVVCNLEQVSPFEGEALVKLNGLPAEATTEEIKINKEATEIRFPVKTTLNTPTGQHKSLFCEIYVPQSGEQVQHVQGRGGVLRVDAPPPPKKDEPEKKPEPKEVAKKDDAPKEKPLSRLEQLRLAAKERAEGGD